MLEFFCWLGIVIFGAEGSLALFMACTWPEGSSRRNHILACIGVGIVCFGLVGLYGLTLYGAAA